MAEPITALTPAPTTIVTAQAPMSFGGLHNPPPFDLIELLPERSQDRLRELRDRSVDARAVCVPHTDLQEASAARIAAENRLGQLTSHPQDHGHNLPLTDNRVVTQQRLVNKLTDDFRRLQERSETRAAAWQTASVALANVEAWLRDGRPHGTVLQDYDGEVPKLGKGENGLLDAIENRRGRVRELRADLHRIASAPFPSSYAKHKMRAQIEALAMQGAPSVSRLVELDGPVDFQTQQVRSEVYNAQAAVAFAEMPDTVALTCWLHKDTLIAALDCEIASEADDKAALSHEARQKAEAEVQGDLLAVERDECALVWQAQAQSLPVEHRADISPLAILQVRLLTVPRADALPETSPGLSWPMRR